MFYIKNNKMFFNNSMIELSAGFTLLELVLVVALIGLVSFFSLSLGSGFLWRTDLSDGQYITVLNMRRAQLLAETAVEDSDWGVHIENNILILFKGNDFSTRDGIFDEEYNLNSVVVTDPVDLIYHKFSGQPYQNSSEVSLTSNSETVVLSIDSEGIINY